MKAVVNLLSRIELVEYSMQLGIIYVPSLLVDGRSILAYLLLILFTFRMKLFIEEFILEFTGIAAAALEYYEFDFC